MQTILMFSGSNSSRSINERLLRTVQKKLKHPSKVIHLTDYELPIYSEDIERGQSFSVDLRMLHNIIIEHSALIISVNEHNGSISAFFKNHIDWLSRLNRNFLADKKILIMSTSPGSRGGQNALEYCKTVFPRFGAEIIESASFPSFHDNFSATENQITNEVLDMGLNDMLSTFEHHIN